MNKKTVYLHDPDYSLTYFGYEHPMKPYRTSLVYELVLGYELDQKLSIYKPPKAVDEQLLHYHTQDYIDFIRSVTPEFVTSKTFVNKSAHFNMASADCPVFHGLYDYVCRAAGSSITAAHHLMDNNADVVVNWEGGLHHAKRRAASGFCYVNDIVLAILELLKVHPRVVYIDIDVHHGDGVEEAFITTNRVMTVSFHQYGDNYFPGSGSLHDTGFKQGTGYAVNVPLKRGLSDATFLPLFTSIIDSVFDTYQPGAVVLQCGADSLANDRLGTFNLTLAGHGGAVDHVLSKNKPTIILGGGGYTLKNVARCWTYETALACGATVNDQMPLTYRAEYFGPENRLNIIPNNTEDENHRDLVENLKNTVLQNLKRAAPAPPCILPKISTIRNEDIALVDHQNDYDRGLDDGTHLRHFENLRATTAQFDHNRGIEDK